MQLAVSSHIVIPSSTCPHSVVLPNMLTKVGASHQKNTQVRKWSFLGAGCWLRTSMSPLWFCRRVGGCYSSSRCWETISCCWPGGCNYKESTANSPSSIPADWPHLEHTSPPPPPFPFNIQSWLLHNEQHLVLIYPQKPKQHQKEEEGRIWEELTAEEIHRKVVREWER